VLFSRDRSHAYRVLRAHKNRFGSTNEIGVFEMKSEGLVEVPDASASFSPNVRWALRAARWSRS